MKYDAVVLAGGNNSPEMAASSGVTNRALTPLGDRTMLDCVVSALENAATVQKIFVVGDVPPGENYTQIAPGETLMDNLLAGIDASRARGETSRILVSTSDIPFLTPAAVDAFVTLADAAQADFCYPIIPIDLCRATFPQMKRTTLRLREGIFTGGNLMLVNPEYVLNQREIILAAYAARKRVGKIGGMLGWGLLARILIAQAFLPGILTLPMLEAGVARLLGPGCRARAIVTPCPEIGTDIDSPADIVVAREMLARNVTLAPERTSNPS